MRTNFFGTVSRACAALLLSAAAAAQSTATMTGTLTDDQSAAPLHGEGVTAFLVRLYNASGQLVASAETNASGQYTIAGVAPGTYFAVAVRFDELYVPELHSNIPCIAADCTPASGTPIVLSAGTTTTIDFGLSKGRRLGGVVRRASNNAGVNVAAVELYNEAGSYIGFRPMLLGGAYSFEHLPPGTYYARVIRSGSPPLNFIPELFGGLHCPLLLPTFQVGCRITDGTPITVTSSADISGIDFEVDDAGSIAGTIVDQSTAQPLAGLVVALYSGSLPLAQTVTGSDGQYSFPDVLPGSYRVRTQAAGNYVDEWYNNVCVGCPGVIGAITVGAGSAVTGIDFSLAAGGSITGSLSGEIRPGNFYRVPIVYVYDAAGVLIKTLDTGLAFTANSPSFSYTVQGLRSGQYFLVARDPLAAPVGTAPHGGVYVDVLYGGAACVTVDCDPRRAIPVNVTAGAVTSGIDFAVVHGATSTNLISGPPFVRLFDARGVELQNVLKRAGGLVPNQFLLVGVPPGTYFATWGNRLHGRGVCTNCPPTAGKPIVIRPGDATFTLDFGGGNSVTLSGTVRNQAGSAPLSTIDVELFTDTGALVERVTTTQDGVYRFNFVFPGTYFLRTQNSRGFVDEIYANAACATCDVTAGTPVVVSTTNVTGLDFTIAQGGSVSGAVVDTAGAALNNVPVSLLSASGAVAGRVITTADGRYRLTLPQDTYRARAEATAANGAEVYQEQPCTGASCDVTAGTPIVLTTGSDTPNVNFTLASCGAMTMSPSSLATAVAGRAYRQVLTVSGGAAPLAFQLTTGALPSGLALSSGGVLSGTPSAPGRFEFSVSAIDNAGCATAMSLALDVHACAFTLSPTSASVAAAGGSVAITITNPCGSATLDFSDSFISVQSTTESQVVLDVAPNTSATARSAVVTIGRRVVVINQGGVVATPPFGNVDSPVEGQSASGSLAVGGWALDDLEVRRVRIYRDPVSGEGSLQVLLGDAVFVPGARPDVRAAYPTYPLNDRAGWGFLILTNMLPNQGNGLFRIYAYADDFEGNRSLLGFRTIVANNGHSTLPFGTIDTPAQGATIAGTSYVNFGWALTPRPKLIPTNGSTIHVIVDGQSIGSPTYNQFRADIATLFTTYENSTGPVGYRLIDTTTLAEGLHTIAWVVFDNQGAGAGIGSRYFTVANSADAQGSVAAGIEAGRHTATLAGMQAAPSQRVELAALERIELKLEEIKEGECAATWAGYLVDNDTLSKLPVGASIDPAGTFYWQPGPGFKGTFNLLFIRTACDGTKQQSHAVVRIGQP